MAFQVEEVPDNANLFRKIHRNHFMPGGLVSSATFRDPRMSVNWEKYCNAEGTADSNSAAVMALVAQECRELKQTVEHTPIEPNQDLGPNQAHVEVCGDKSKVVSRQLRDKARLVWCRPAQGLASGAPAR